MPETAPLSLDSVSVLLVWTAIVIYALAFIAYAIDLARRSAQAVEVKDARQRELVGAGALDASRQTIGQVREQERAADEALTARPADRPRLVWARIGTALTVLAFLFHVSGDVTRGLAAGRVPWSNMYEFSLTGTMLVVAVYLAVLFRYDLRFLGSFITGLVVLLLTAGGTKSPSPSLGRVGCSTLRRRPTRSGPGSPSPRAASPSTQRRVPTCTQRAQCPRVLRAGGAGGSGRARWRV